MKNHDAGDVRGLEEVFRSQEISRASEGIRGDGGNTSRDGRDDALLRRMFGHSSSAIRDLHRDDHTRVDVDGALSHVVVPVTELDAAMMPERSPHAAASGGGAALGENDAAVFAEPPWKRQSGRYRTIAALSALVALVVAGVTAGSVHPGPPHRSAAGAARGQRARTA